MTTNIETKNKALFALTSVEKSLLKARSLVENPITITYDLNSLAKKIGQVRIATLLSKINGDNKVEAPLYHEIKRMEKLALDEIRSCILDNAEIRIASIKKELEGESLEQHNVITIISRLNKHQKDIESYIKNYTVESKIEVAVQLKCFLERTGDVGALITDLSNYQVTQNDLLEVLNYGKKRLAEQLEISKHNVTLFESKAPSMVKSLDTNAPVIGHEYLKSNSANHMLKKAVEDCLIYHRLSPIHGVDAIFDAVNSMIESGEDLVQQDVLNLVGRMKFHRKLLEVYGKALWSSDTFDHVARNVDNPVKKYPTDIEFQIEAYLEKIRHLNLSVGEEVRKISNKSKQVA